MISWKNINHPSYHGDHDHNCDQCGNPCSDTLWGTRCFLCNVQWMTRLTNRDQRVASYQTRLRMVLAAAAYAYEIDDDPLISDHEFDGLSLRVDLSIDTNRPFMDNWFREQFDPSTGLWVRKHPDLDGVRRVLADLRSGKMVMGLT